MADRPKRRTRSAVLPFLVKMHLPIPTALLLLGFLAAVGCAPKDNETESEVLPEILTTEDIGGAIDAELSTEEDPRGPRTAGSRSVLPAGFPAEVPVPAGASVFDRGTTEDGQSFVVLEAAIPASNLFLGWLALLEAEGWRVGRSGESRLSATQAELTITAGVVEAGSGSRLRIVY